MDFLSIVSIFPYASPITSPSPQLPANGSLYFFYGFIALIIFRRILSGVRGRRYSTRRVLSLPVVYMILTIMIVVPLELQNTFALTSLAFIAPGLGIGYLFGKQYSFFDRGGFTYFKRSPVIMSIWLASYIGRIVVSLVLTGNFEVSYIVDAVLALTAGMLLGEGIHLLRGHSEYVNGPKEKPEAEEGYEMMKEL